MSWQQYVDTYLTGSGKVSEAGIISAAGDGSIWARSPHFQLSPEEAQRLAASFADTGQAAASGVHVGGRKYMFLRGDDDAVYAKEHDDGVVAMKTRSTIIVAQYTKGTLPGECATAVGRIADYLRDSGF